MDPIISVIIPVYNVEKYLSKCIESIIQQTYINLEIILINDGSTDRSLSICESYKRLDTRIKLINKSNGGLSDARNMGLKHATGEYIYFIDSDDWCEENTIETLYLAISRSNSDICICSYSIDYVNEKYSLIREIDNQVFISEDNIRQSIYHLDKKGMLNVVWNKLYKKNIILNNHLLFEIDGMPGEDLLFNVEYFKNITSICFIKDVLYHYIRQDEVTLVSKYNEDLYNQVIRFNKARKSLYEHYNMLEGEFIEVYKMSYIDYIFSCISNIYRSDKVSFNVKIEQLKLIKQNKEFVNYLQCTQGMNIYSNLYKKIIGISNIYISNLIFIILFFIRNKLSKLYKYCRKLIFIRGINCED